MRAADDFSSIRARLFDLHRRPKVDPEACPQHSFDPVEGRYVHCNLHYFHLPALQNCKPPDADAADPPCPRLGC
jgi:hypothetical protein